MSLLLASTKLKLSWYLLFSVIGVFHAEVLSGSQPAVLYDPLTFAFVTPVYAVHYVLFGDLILRARRTDFGTVYLFGCLTGMYETFITKVYWSPPWNPGGVGLLGIAWIELLWIGFTWHAFMTFLIPFRFMRSLFTPGAGGGFGTRSLSAVLWIVPVIAATFAFGFGRPLEEILLSVGLSLLIILLLALGFLWGAQRWGFTDSDQLVLGRRGRRLAIFAFVAVYVGYGILLRPEFFPLGLPLLTILLIYAGLLGLLALNWRESDPGPANAPFGHLERRASLRYWVTYALAFVGVILAFAGLHTLAPAVLPIASVGLMLAGVGLPVILLAAIAMRLFRSSSPVPESVDSG